MITCLGFNITLHFVLSNPCLLCWQQRQSGPLQRHQPTAVAQRTPGRDSGRGGCGWHRLGALHRAGTWWRLHPQGHGLLHLPRSAPDSDAGQCGWGHVPCGADSEKGELCWVIHERWVVCGQTEKKWVRLGHSENSKFWVIQKIWLGSGAHTHTQNVSCKKRWVWGHPEKFRLFWVIPQLFFCFYCFVFLKLIQRKGVLCWVLQKKAVLGIHEKDVLCRTYKKRWIVLGNTAKGESCTGSCRKGWFALGHT